MDKDFKNKLNITEDLSGDLTLYALFVKPTAIAANRNLAKPYVVCGSYSASLQTGHPDNATVNAIIDGPGAWHEYISGKEYIADHNYHGASAFLYNDYLTIVREDGTEENYVKVSTSSILWTPGLSTDLLGTFFGELITQTCKGDDVVFNGWNKQ